MALSANKIFGNWAMGIGRLIKFESNELHEEKVRTETECGHTPAGRQIKNYYCGFR